MNRILMYLSAFLVIGCADFSKNLDEAIKISQSSGVPTQSESVNATKQALEQGVMKGISYLQQEDGFLKSAHHVAIPSELQATSQLARKLGLGSYVDDFEVSLNRAAEQAISSARPIFNDAIKQLSFEDVVTILTGPENAATAFFRTNSEKNLKDAFKPIIAKASEENQVSKLYSQIVTSVKPAAMAAGIKITPTNLDEYVTQRTIDALFIEIAKQEKSIRDNPVERSTALLKKVFSYYESPHSSNI